MIVVPHTLSVFQASSFFRYTPFCLERKRNAAFVCHVTSRSIEVVQRIVCNTRGPSSRNDGGTEFSGPVSDWNCAVELF